MAEGDGIARRFTCVSCASVGIAPGTRGRLPRHCSSQCMPKPDPRPRSVKKYGKCTVCGGPARTKRNLFCGNACKVAAQRALRPKVDCRYCGRTFQRKKGSRDSRQYCSRECAFANGKVVGRTGNWPAPFSPVYFLTCSHCHSVFVAQRVRSACSEECSKALERTRMRAYAERLHRAEAKKCVECGAAFVPEYGDKRRSFCSKQCGLRYGRRGRAKNYHSRAKQAGVARRYFNVRRIFERDKWTCQLCGCKTPKVLRGTTQPNAPELDHVIPIAEGGAHVQENVQCACRRCNSEKGARPRGQLWLAGMADTR